MKTTFLFSYKILAGLAVIIGLFFFLSMPGAHVAGQDSTIPTRTPTPEAQNPPSKTDPDDSESSGAEGAAAATGCEQPPVVRTLTTAVAHQGPGTAYAVVATLSPGTEWPLLGSAPAAPGWWLIALDEFGGQAWVRETAVALQGSLNPDCALLLLITNLPSPATPATPATSTAAKTETQAVNAPKRTLLTHGENDMLSMRLERLLQAGYFD